MDRASSMSSRPCVQVRHGESVEYVELVGEGVELELDVRSVGERQRRYPAVGVLRVERVDQFATDVEQTAEVGDADTRRRADGDRQVRLRRHTCTTAINAHLYCSNQSSPLAQLYLKKWR